MLFLPVLPLLRPEVPVAIPLRPFDPSLNLLAAEESCLARLVMRNAVEIQPAADEFNLRVTRDHPPQSVLRGTAVPPELQLGQLYCEIKGKSKKGKSPRLLKGLIFFKVQVDASGPSIYTILTQM